MTKRQYSNNAVETLLWSRSQKAQHVGSFLGRSLELKTRSGKRGLPPPIQADISWLIPLGTVLQLTDMGIISFIFIPCWSFPLWWFYLMHSDSQDFFLFMRDFSTFNLFVYFYFTLLWLTLCWSHLPQTEGKWGLGHYHIWIIGPCLGTTLREVWFWVGETREQLRVIFFSPPGK